ncbi:MAG: 2-oxoglutarate dehydrogenase, E2 component, dihydrolipoamide succinyltransferase [Aeromicrobium sp.]|uniref:2-oxoglutarate dehydrogenase, E2 component, dihydrolipoamide succinyltransferase n=1 Tax=Aeromicrobium sp. TaxID=1871063 RepID=UPI0039E47CD6
MATEVTLPALGESVTEGTVTQWLKAVGDTVAVDEPLLEISTDKVDTEIPSPVAGVLLEIKAEEDEEVEVGAVLAVIGDASEAGGSAAPAAEPAAAEPAPEPEPTPVVEPVAAAAEPEPAPAAEAPAPSGPVSGTPVTLPALGESVTEGTVTQWLKAVGDTVAVDEPLLEISTDKVDTEIPSPVAGTLLEIKAEEDETVEVGAELAIIGSADAAPAAAPAEPTPTPEPAPEPAPTPEPAPEPTSEPVATSAPEPVAPAQPAAPSDGYVTPIVRKLAKEHGVDLADVTGSGVGGRIRKADVLEVAERQKQAAQAAEAAAPTPVTEVGAAAAAPTPAPAAPSPLRGKTEPLSRLRTTIARRMVESLQVSAQLTQVHEVDVTEVARLRAKHKDAFAEREGVKLTFLPFFAKAAVEALKLYPQVNSALDLDAGTVTYPAGEHLGVAVDTDRGLLVPTIRDAGDLSIAGLARKIADIADRTRANKIGPDEISGATFSISNLGSNGALFDTPIINQPQVAILGVGKVVKRPVVITDEQGNDSIAVRQTAYLALTYDHRVIDGADAGRFLTAIRERLEAGAFEAELGS